jgi:hypothetical protein
MEKAKGYLTGSRTLSVSLSPRELMRSTFTIVPLSLALIGCLNPSKQLIYYVGRPVRNAIPNRSVT